MSTIIGLVSTFRLPLHSDLLVLDFFVDFSTLKSNPARVDFSFGLLLASRSSNVQPDVSPTRGRTSVRHERPLRAP